MSRRTIVPHVRLGLLAAILATGALAVDMADLATRGSAAPAVKPLELARWIRADLAGLDVVDVRDATAFEAGHVPGARNAPLPDFDGVPDEPGAILVVYADTGDSAVAGASRALAAGLAMNVYVLERGLDGWLADVMAPRISADATGPERAAFAVQSELSRWFGGLPRVFEGTEDPTSTPPRRSLRLLRSCH